MSDDSASAHYRTLFVSDIHLGKRGCQAAAFLDFLRVHDAGTIYLVGDVIDGWALRKGWYWPQSHNDVIQKLLRKARKGARIVFVPGNHDEFARQYLGMSFGGVEVVGQAVHEMADGRRFLVVHGDLFDVVVTHARVIALLGDWAYELALFLNRGFNRARRRLGLPYWSFSAWAKLKVKDAVNFIGKFEATLAEEARRKGCDGVVCGHIHHAAIREVDGITYVNAGDFVESCTAIAEHYDGRLEILDWSNGAAQAAHAAPIDARQPQPARREAPRVAARSLPASNG